MKLLRDPLGRPILRPYFKAGELDEQCEQIIADFMDRHSGGFKLPIPTDEIIRLIEAESDDLDMYADLPEELDGYTAFFCDRKPHVLIAKRLSDPRYEKRLRMTLAHEFGHVHFHAPLWRDSQLETDRRPAAPAWTCNRDTIVAASEHDWMEWQAAYIGGALLMPRDSIRLWAQEIAMSENTNPPLGIETDLGQRIIVRVTRRCQVSDHAAQVRLRQLGLLSP